MVTSSPCPFGQEIAGATNVIPGLATFSVDVRSASNDKRKKAVRDIKERIQEIAARRRLVASIETTHEQNTWGCSVCKQSRAIGRKPISDHRKGPGEHRSPWQADPLAGRPGYRVEADSGA
jgi:metal-dependent amidase/aminoacylase/carboxypeptidase family protein